MKILTTILLVLVAAPAFAQDLPSHPALQDRFWLGAGAFFPQTNTQASLTSNRTGVGTTIDLEQTMDLERSKTVPTFVGRWRMGERWRIDAEYFQLNRHSERAVDRDITWGDQTIPVNASVQTKFNFSDLRVSVGYSFFRRKDKELGVGLGLHMAAYDISLTTANFGSEGEDVLAPLPVLSAYGQFALTDTWAVGARLDRFSLSYDKYEGSLTSLALDLLYQPFRHVGFGAGYRALAIRAEAEGDHATLRMRQTFQGPLVYMNVSF
jgi:hypothetical protein